VSSISRVKRFAYAPVLAVVAVAADLLAVAAALSNDGVVAWLSGNPVFVMVLFAVLVLVIVSTSSLLFGLRSALRARDAQIESLEARLKEPSGQDVQRYAEFRQLFGPKSELYEWLRERFYTDKAMEFEVDALIEVLRAWDADPTNYHDEEVATAFELLHTNTRELRRQLGMNYWYADFDRDVEIGRRLLRLPIEWEVRDHERYYAACAAIGDAFDRLMESYKRFVETAHAKRLG